MKRGERLPEEALIEHLDLDVVPIGIMMEWFDLEDAKWIGKAPPVKGTKEYIDVIDSVQKRVTFSEKR